MYLDARFGTIGLALNFFPQHTSSIENPTTTPSRNVILLVKLWECFSPVSGNGSNRLVHGRQRRRRTRWKKEAGPNSSVETPKRSRKNGTSCVLMFCRFLNPKYIEIPEYRSRTAKTHVKQSKTKESVVHFSPVQLPSLPCSKHLQFQGIGRSQRCSDRRGRSNSLSPKANGIG